MPPRRLWDPRGLAQDPFNLCNCGMPRAEGRLRNAHDFGSKRKSIVSAVFSGSQEYRGILDGRGWQLGDSGRREAIDASEISVLRGHEFPIMALDLRKRFRDFKTVGRAEFQGQPTIQIDMTDDLGHSVSGYFSSISHLPAGLIVTNARSWGPRTITIRFDAWKLVGGVKLVSHVTILAGSETWVFDFKTLRLNTAGKAAFQLPGTPTWSSDPK
jgi:hypothetical protein